MQSAKSIYGMAIAIVLHLISFEFNRGSANTSKGSYVLVTRLIQVRKHHLVLFHTFSPMVILKCKIASSTWQGDLFMIISPIPAKAMDLRPTAYFPPNFSCVERGQ